MIKQRVATGIRVPGPIGMEAMRAIPMLLQNPAQVVIEATYKYGDVVLIGELGKFRIYVINQPDYIKQIMQDTNRAYKKGFLFEKVKSTLGEGLIVSEGDLWRQQRRLMQPAFHRQRIAGLGSTMTHTTADMLERWNAVAARGATLDVADEMMRLTLEIVVKCLFSTDVSRSDIDAVGRGWTVAHAYLNKRIRFPFDIPQNWPLPENRTYQRALRLLDQIVYRVINERRRSGGEMHDLLGMLLAARDEDTGVGMGNRQVRDEVLTMFIAGHETTATTLAWTWYFLSRNPAVERKLHAEVAGVLAGRIPTVDDLPNLVYTRMVIQEVLRLYPSIWATTRTPLADVRFGAYTLPAGSILVISPYAMHRHPAYWDNPEGFDPERFAPDLPETRPRYTYFPFGGGPRICIGESFAMMEAQLIIAIVVQAYQLTLIPGHSAEAQAQITIRPRNGVHVRLHKRNDLPPNAT